VTDFEEETIERSIEDRLAELCHCNNLEDVIPEILRWMEWARRERTKEAKRMISQRRAPSTQWVSTEDTLHTMDLLDEPLSLPPEDWKP
jgi:hypothetical protein